MCLLLAEDDRDLSKAVAALLTRANYSVDAVYDGVDAFDYARSGEYDGMILDVMMPGMDGFSVIRKLRDAGVATPCIMLTARDQVSDRIEGLEAGAAITCPSRSRRRLLARVRPLRRKSDFSRTWTPSET